MALEHLPRTLHLGGEGVEHVRAGAVEQNLDEHQEPAPELDRIEFRPKSQNEPLARQPAHALGRGGGRETDPLGEIRDGDPPVELQRAEDPAVETIQSVDIVVHEGSSRENRGEARQLP